MGDDLEDVKNKMISLSDNELLRIVHVEFDNYREEAIAIAKEEIKRRNIREINNEKETLHKEVKVENRSLKVAKYFFWLVLFYGCYTGLQASTGSTKGKMVALFGPLKPGYSFLVQLICSITVFGILPVIYFIIHSSKLSPDQRREQGLSLFMPKYILIIYVISLFLLGLPFILSSFGL